MHGAIGLVALAFGYLTFVQAAKEKEGIKTLGQVIGIFVMVVAALAVLCSAMKCVGKGSCPMMARNGCPVTSKMSGSLPSDNS